MQMSTTNPCSLIQKTLSLLGRIEKILLVRAAQLQLDGESLIPTGWFQELRCKDWLRAQKHIQTNSLVQKLLPEVQFSWQALITNGY